MNEQTQTRSPAPKRKRRLGKLLGILVVLVVVGLVGAELGCRYVYGLGDPPLYQLDPDVEYLLVPGKSYRELGNDFAVNSYSMRAGEIPKVKASDELRVLIVGDSIVNGGARIDQKQLATELLRDMLVHKTGKAVVVGNASAASWGPPNELAYIKKFGTFDADVVILVLNSDDSTDVPGTDGIGGQWPRSKPVLALQEVWDRAGVRLLRQYTGIDLDPKAVRMRDPAKDEPECLEAERAFFELAKAKGAKVALMQHLKRSEVVGRPQEGYERLKGVADKAGVLVISDRNVMNAGLKVGQDPYFSGDDIHTNASGQELIAGVLQQIVMELISPVAPEKTKLDGGSKSPDSN